MPVRIVNGEIVHDEVPSSRRRFAGSVHTIHTPPQTPAATNVFQNRASASASSRRQGVSSSSSSSSAGSDAAQGGVGPDQGLAALRRPFDALSERLGIDDKVFNIPGVAAIGLTPTEVKLIYALAVLALYIFFRERGLMFAVLFFALYKHSNP